MDPLNDPRFPDRPQHPDYWRLAQTAQMLDGRAVEGGEPTSVTVGDFVDMESLQYTCEQRVGLMLQGIGLDDLPDHLRTVIITAMLGGIVHGIVFEKAGGHQA